MCAMTIGLDAISLWSSRYYLEVADLAAARGVSSERFVRKMGQERMAVSPPGEDAVTLAANATHPLLNLIDPERLELLVLGTETGVDQSKAAGIYVHRLLGLPASCRVFEVKQACYGSTAALVMAAMLLRARPESQALVIASDIARYGLGTPGEPTQGAGAVAMLLSAKPALVALDDAAGYHVEDVMDFWRPAYRDEALVDGQASIRIYLRSLGLAWERYREADGRAFTELGRFCYHLPFTRMAEMAHRHLARTAGEEPTDADMAAQLESSLRYNRLIGNTYAGSLYVALASLLDHDDDLAGIPVGLFSYGSGCMAEFFSGVVQPQYRQRLDAEAHAAMLAGRQRLDVAAYEEFYRANRSGTGADEILPVHDTGRFRLAAYRGHQRIYELVEDS